MLRNKPKQIFVNMMMADIGYLFCLSPFKSSYLHGGGMNDYVLVGSNKGLILNITEFSRTGKY
jgi:hypothetical protein